MGQETGPFLRQLMKQFALVQNLLEMAAKKTCPTCGHGMAGFHYWYKGAWKCKSSSLANPNVAAATGAAPQPVAQTPASPAAPTPPVQQAAPTPDLTTPIGGAVQVDKTAIKYFLNTKMIMNYTIEDDGTVNVGGNVELDNMGSQFRELPVQFGKVTGNFITKDVALQSFKGFPKEVGGDFVIKQRIIVKDYTGAPEIIRGDALMKPVQAQSLKGFPKKIEQSAVITVSGDKHSLSDLGEFGSGLYINVEDAPLPNFHGIQSKFNGRLEIWSKGATSLEGFPEVDDDIILVVPDKAVDVTRHMHKHIKRMNGTLTLQFGSLHSKADKSDVPPLLSVLFIKGITAFSFSGDSYSASTASPVLRDIQNQINTVITDKLDVHDFQERLIDSGFAKAARL